MKIGILHLSDIHIKSENDWICNKVEHISNAIHGTWEDLHTVFVTISGDISYSGSVAEFLAADQFLDNLRSTIESGSNTKVVFVLAPGNHDCDLSESAGDLKARKSFIDTILANPSVVELGDSIYEGCLAVQKNFFDFARGVEPNLGYPNEPQVFFRLKSSIGNHKFVFNVFNTAWLSQIREAQGKLYFPVELVELSEVELDTPDLTVGIFHHPDNWLDSINSQAFRRLTEQSSDVILSGHEHARDRFQKQDLDLDSTTQIIRSGALQDNTPSVSSGFNVVVVDLEAKRQKVFEYRWKSDQYAAKKEGDWQPFVRNRFLQRRSFYHSPDFDVYLNSNDSGLQHSRKRNLTNEDLFIFPSLIITSLNNVLDGKPASKRIDGPDVFDFVRKQRQILIFGETWQGKTTLAKILIKRFYQSQVVPVLVTGENIKSASPQHLDSVVADAVSVQFNVSLLESFRQLRPEKRVLIIDDLGSSNLSQSSIQELLAHFSSKFETVVAFAHNNLSLQQNVKNSEGGVRLSDYTHCKILPLDATQRTKLIRNWVRLDCDPCHEEKELVRQENLLRSSVMAAVNTGVVASTPFFILGILQLIESFQTNPQAQFGSIGYIYHGVVTSKLARLRKTPTDINQIFLIVSLIAFRLYEEDQREISEQDLDEVIKSYNVEYRESLYLPALLGELREAQILIQLSNGNWKFVGDHLRDFFVAKHFVRSIANDGSDEKEQALRGIRLMIETILYEPHMRILLFLVYEANSNQQLVKWILSEAKKVFSDSPQINLESDVDFLNKIKGDVLTNELLRSDDPLENQDRDDELEGLDERDESFDLERRFEKRNLVRYSDELDNFTKAAIALKMMELVGQLVKSFRGTIKAELKHQLIEECINIGMRFLGSMFHLQRDNLGEVKDIVSNLIRARHPRLSDNEVIGRTDNLLVVIHHGLAYGVTKKISHSIGHEGLRGSLDDVLRDHDGLSHKLVETAIRLDHFDNPVAEKLIKFGSELKENKFVFGVLCRLIADYLNYFEVVGPDRQRLVDSFGLSRDKGYLLNEDKTMRDSATRQMPKPDNVFKKDRKK